MMRAIAPRLSETAARSAAKPGQTCRRDAAVRQRAAPDFVDVHGTCNVRATGHVKQMCRGEHADAR